MEFIDLKKVFATHPVISELNDLLGSNNPILLKGVKGSFIPFISPTFSKKFKVQLFLMPDYESAAYLFNDLEKIMDEQDVFFFPSSKKLSIKQTKTDHENILLRSELLQTLRYHSNPLYIVSYPEAIAEKVMNGDEFDQKNLQLAVNDKLDLSFITEVLEEYGFTYNDFVYEPGQYAIRGSIVDVYSYSSEKPFRIDFNDNLVESIRTFDVESQLSIEKVNKVSILPNIQEDAKNWINLFQYINSSLLVWVNGLNYIYKFVDDFVDKVTKDANHTIEKYSRSAEFKLFFKEKAHIEIGLTTEKANYKVVQVEQFAQPIFKKNFSMLANDLAIHNASNFKVYILSDQQKQLDRLRSIFDEIANPPVKFEKFFLKIGCANCSTCTTL